MIFRSHALKEFWDYYRALPRVVQEQADKQYELFAANPHHPSLRLKEIGPYCTVRVSRGYRALARRKGNEFFWFWIGTHDDYERFIDG